MPFEPVIGGSFDALAAQRAGYASLNANIESQNANRAVAAQDAVNRWLAQASELRQRAMDQDAYRADATQQNQIAQVMSERKFSFDAAQEAARLSEERRRTDQMAKKAEDQLQQNRDIISAQEKQQALKSAQDIQDYGSTFAAKYPGSKRTADETEAAYRKLESEQEALTAEKEALQAHPTQSHFFKGNTLSPESTDRITEINKLLRENAKELGDRGKISRAWDAASKSHTKLVDQMTGYGFIPDDANGFIFHGGSQQKFPFNTGTQPVQQAAPVNAGPGGPIAAMSAATMTGTTPQPMPAPLVAPRVTPPAPAIAAPMPAPVTGTAQPQAPIIAPPAAPITAAAAAIPPAPNDRNSAALVPGKTYLVFGSPMVWDGKKYTGKGFLGSTSTVEYGRDGFLKRPANIAASNPRFQWQPNPAHREGDINTPVDISEQSYPLPPQNPKRREYGTIYQTPQGPMQWVGGPGGEGWVPAT